MADWEVVSQDPIAPPQGGGGWEVVSQTPVSWGELPVDPVSGVADANAAQTGPDYKRAAKIFVDDLTGIPGQMWEGTKALGSRAASDVAGVMAGNPQNAVSDLGAIARKLNPITSGYDTIKKIVTDPAGAGEEVQKLIADPEHPAQSLLNLVTLGTGAKVTAGQAALKGLTATAREAANIPTMAMAGIDRKSLNTILEAGKKGGPEGRIALEQMRGGDPLPVAYDALDAAKQLASDKNAAYLADAAQWKIPGQIADVNPVLTAHSNAVAANTMPLTGAARNAGVQEALDKLNDIITRHTVIPASRTPQGVGAVRLGRLSMDEMDALKQELGGIIHAKDTPGNVKAMAGPIYDAAKQSAIAANPRYAIAMEDAQKRIQRLNDIVTELSLKDKAGKGTILRKLQSAMRENVTSGFRARGKMLEELSTKDPTLPYALAGQDMSALMPRGLSRVLPGLEGTALVHAAVHGGLGSVLNSATLAALVPVAAVSSPRAAGEIRYGLGLLNRGAGTVGLTQQNIGRATEAARVAGLLADDERKPPGLLNP